jgi:hypothetical protein
MIKDGFDLLTYRAGQCRRIHERRFTRRRTEFDGRSVDYLLHDQPVGFLKGRLRLRQVTRLCDDGHQSSPRPAALKVMGSRAAGMPAEHSDRAGRAGRSGFTMA